MTTWNNQIALTSPPAIAPVVSSLESMASTAGTVLSAAQTAADALSALLVYSANPIAAAAETLAHELKTAISDVFGSGGHILCAHPYMRGYRGENKGISALSFPNCIDRLAKEFDDLADTQRPVYSTGVQVELIALVAGGPSPTLFASVLESLVALFDLKDFQLALRRIKQALKLEEVRFVRRTGSRPPDWQSFRIRDFKPMGDLEKTLLGNLAMIEGFAKGSQSAIGHAADLIQKKTDQLAQLQTELDNVVGMLSGSLTNSGIYSLYTKQAGSKGVQDALKKAGGRPGHEVSFTAGILLVAPEPGLTGLKEVLSL